MSTSSTTEKSSESIPIITLLDGDPVTDASAPEGLSENITTGPDPGPEDPMPPGG